MHIQGATIRHVGQLADSVGDTWSVAWADDDELYVTCDDGRGFHDACNSNLAINHVMGDTIATLAGDTINPMTAFGTLGERGDDDATWKANGMTSVDGTLYLFVSRHCYGMPPYFVQQAWDASLLRSTDHGRTWTSPPALDQPLFPGRVFGAPFFLQNGRDERGAAGDDYLYALSSDGVWNNGSTMTLGRVRRRDIGDLDGRAWEYFVGTQSNMREVYPEPVWTRQPERAGHVLRAPGRLGMAGAYYIAQLGCYLLPQWSYVEPADTSSLDWVSFVMQSPTRLDLYSASLPWGPWNLIHSATFTEGWYNPAIVGKFISTDGLTVPMLAAGLGRLHGQADYANYGCNVLQMTLQASEIALP